jgi:hypothetical protein
MVAAAAPTAAGRPLLDVAVVVEPDVTLNDADLKTLAEGVRAIWRPAADVRLRRSGGLPAPVGADTIQLVLTTRVRRVSGPALGWVDFVDGVPQPVVTVSETEITALMEAARWQGRALDTMPAMVRQWFVRRALTCAVAHEIGHYLLRSTAHSKHGLMQSGLGADDIMDRSARVVRLSADEIARVVHRQEMLATTGGSVAVYNRRSGDLVIW